MKVICVFLVFDAHHKQHILWGQIFASRQPEKIGEIPQTFESKKLEKKLLMTIPFLAPR
jgi:hypothetical protein